MAVHYVATDGSGDFTTIAQVNAHALSPGDSVLFRKGDTWRETLTVGYSGNAGGWITYGSYGSGNKPKILGSNITTWAPEGHTNIYVCAATVTNPYISLNQGCDLMFDNNGTITQGLMKTYTSNFSNLTTEYNWTYNGSKVYVYAASDPDTRYTSVEISQRDYAINLNMKEYIEIDGLDLRYFLKYGTYGGTYNMPNVGYLTIKNCDISWSGVITPGVQNDKDNYGIHGVYSHMLVQGCTIHDMGRRSVSLYNYSSGFTVTDIIVENCTLYRSYHTTGVDISCGNGTTSDFDGIIIRNNLIYEDENSYNYTCEGINAESYFNANVKIKNLQVYSNVIKFPQNSGLHLYGVQNALVYNNVFYGHCSNTPNGNVVHIKFTGAPSTGVVIKNNIFYTLNPATSNSVGNAILTYASQPDSGLTLDYNIYYRVSTSCVLMELRDGSNTVYHYNDIATIRSVQGWEVHGQTINPSFTSSTDYHLAVGSPAIGAGVYVSLLTDHDGNNWNNPPSVGAYEYGSVSFQGVTITKAKIHKSHVY
jgi:hypothetical protein